MKETIGTVLIDRDLDRLIAGEPPLDDDLTPLTEFVKALSGFANTPVSDEFVDEHAALAASTMREMLDRSPSVPPATSSLRTRWLAVRNKTTAALTSLVMLTGITGVAWASDAAVPGDWNYGIDRALEVIGIGAGGARERLLELSSVEDPNGDATLYVAGDQPQQTIQEGDAPVGLANAAQRVVANDNGGERSEFVHAGVALLLDYLENVDRVDGPTVSELAKMFAKTVHGTEKNQADGQPGKSGEKGKSGENGKSGEAGQPPSTGRTTHKP